MFFCFFGLAFLVFLSIHFSPFRSFQSQKSFSTLWKKLDGEVKIALNTRQVAKWRRRMSTVDSKERMKRFVAQNQASSPFSFKDTDQPKKQPITTPQIQVGKLKAPKFVGEKKTKKKKKKVTEEAFFACFALLLVSLPRTSSPHTQTLSASLAPLLSSSVLLLLFRVPVCLWLVVKPSRPFCTPFSHKTDSLIPFGWVHITNKVTGKQAQKRGAKVNQCGLVLVWHISPHCLYLFAIALIAE